jgi:hypothetical protein
MTYWIAIGILLYLVALTRAHDGRLQKRLQQAPKKIEPRRALFFRAAQHGLFLWRARKTPPEKGEPLAEVRCPAKTEPDGMSAKPVAGNERLIGATPPTNRRSFVYGGLRKAKAAN